MYIACTKYLFISMSLSALLNQNNSRPTIKVVSDSLVPQQVSTPMGLRKSADCYQQKFIKFPYIGVFHSYAELIHAALLEADQSIISFVPQPFTLHIGHRRYVPDCYYVRNGKRIVVELKPRGEFKEELQIPLTAFLKFNGLQFKVISNEEILDQEILGMNWLHIIRTLITAEMEDTTTSELTLYGQILEGGEQSVGDVISIQNRLGHRATEIALFRLAYRGKVKLSLNKRLISLKTRISCT